MRLILKRHFVLLYQRLHNMFITMPLIRAVANTEEPPVIKFAIAHSKNFLESEFIQLLPSTGICQGDITGNSNM